MALFCISTVLCSIIFLNSISILLGRKYSLCVGCGGEIHDQYILRVAPNLEWHAACLKCSQCQKFLDEKCTCFVRDGKIYCKEDYVRYYSSQSYVIKSPP